MFLPELRLDLVGLIAAYTFFGGWLGTRFLREQKAKIFLSASLLGIFFYCGIGYGYAEVVPREYGVYYAIFVAAFTIAFTVITRHMQTRAWVLSWLAARETRVGQTVERFGIFFVAPFLVVLMFGLVYPEFVIDRLWSPPTLSLGELWNEGVTRQLDAFEMVTQNVQVLLFPLFLIALNRYRRAIPTTVLLIVLPYYIDFCRNQYMPRSAILAILVLILVPMWFEYPAYRKLILICGVALAPLLLAVMYVWAASRLTGEVADVDLPLWQMASELIIGETNFPIFSASIFDLDHSLDTVNYLLWVIALPLPRVLFPDKPTIQVGFDIAEILGGLAPGESGFSVILTGPVTESVYIFGKSLFWLQATLIGGMAGFASHVSSRNRRCVYVYAYLLYSFSYVFARAGAGGLLPIALNQFFSFYLLYLYNRFWAGSAPQDVVAVVPAGEDIPPATLDIRRNIGT